jgi:hypothetical protein
MFDIPSEESDSLCDFSSDSVFIVIYQHGDFTYRQLRKLCESFTLGSVMDLKTSNLS